LGCGAHKCENSGMMPICITHPATHLTH
jgi:hypothetical protein